MNTTSKQTRGAWALAAALPLVLAACGDQASEAQAPSDGESVAAAAVPGGVAGGPLDVEPGTEVAPQDVVDRLLSADADQLSSFSLVMQGEGDGLEMQLNAIVDAGQELPAVDARLSMSGAEVTNEGLEMMSDVHLIVAGGSAYLSMPSMTGQGQYFAVPMEDADLNELSMEGMGTGSEADIFAEGGLEDMWQEWDDSGATMTYVGSDDGLDQYAISVDGEELDVDGEASVNVWIGEDDLMREITMSAAEIDVTMLFDNWGQDAQITAPDESNVTQMEDFNL